MDLKTPTVVLALCLVTGFAATALAQGTDASARQQAAQERMKALHDARAAVIAAFHEDRKEILEEYRASLNATRATFLAEKAAVLEACNATRAAFTNNSEGDGSPEHAKCVSDGLKPLVEEARAENKAARELAHSKLRDLRATSMAAWAKSLREANEHYQTRTARAPGA